MSEYVDTQDRRAVKRQSALGAEEATDLIITVTQLTALEPPKYAFALQKKSPPVSILLLHIRRIGRAASKI